MGVSAFAFVEGAMNRLKERADAEKKAEQELALEDKKYKNWKKMRGADSLLEFEKGVETHKWELEQKKEAKERARKEKIIGGSYQDPITFMGREIMSAQEVAVNPEVTPFKINMIGTTENDFQGFNLGIVDRDDAQKKQLNTSLSDGSEFSQKFLKNYRTGLSAFMMKTRGTEGPAGNVRQHIVKTGVPILDNMIDEVVYTPEYKNLISNRERLRNNPLVAYQKKDAKGGVEYFIGTEAQANTAKGEGIVGVQSFLFSHPFTKRSYGTIDKYTKDGPKKIGIDLYKGVLLADADSNAAIDATPIFLDMIRANNLPFYTRDTGNPDKDAEWNANKGKAANVNLATAILDASPYMFMEWNGTDFINGPEGSKETKIFFDKITNQLDLSQKFLIKGASAKFFLSNLLDVGTIGGYVAPFNSFAETLGVGLINYFSVGEKSPLYKTITDNVLSLLDPEDVNSIKSTVKDYTVGTLQNLYEDGSVEMERATAVFGDENIYKEKFTKADLEAGKDFLEENKTIIAKARAGQVLNSRERYKAAVFSMAYTYASYVQGGTGGTRTVSDADIIYALKMLGLNPGGKGDPDATEVKSLGSAITKFNDRYNEIVRESVPNALILNSKIQKFPEATHTNLKSIISNYKPEEIADLVHVAGGTRAQNAEYALKDAFKNAYMSGTKDTAEERQQRIINEFKENPKVINNAMTKINDWVDTFATEGTANPDAPKRKTEAKNHKNLLKFILQNPDVFGEELVTKATKLQIGINKYY